MHNSSQIWKFQFCTKAWSFIVGDDDERMADDSNASADECNGYTNLNDCRLAS